MKTIMKSIILCGLLIMAGISCTSANITTPIPSATSEILSNWWAKRIVVPACKPPCWQNITPGVTAIDEAISTLENLPETEITFRTEDGVDWEFNNEEGGTLTASQDGIVRMIRIETISDEKLFLKTIVANYEYPEYVKPHDCRDGMCSTALIYPDLGLFLDVFVENAGPSDSSPQVEIMSDTPVNHVYFIEPGIETFLRLYDLQESDSPIKWKGYGEYP